MLSCLLTCYVNLTLSDFTTAAHSHLDLASVATVDFLVFGLVCILIHIFSFSFSFYIQNTLLLLFICTHETHLYVSFTKFV